MDTFDFKMAQARAMMALDSSSGPARTLESNMFQVRNAEEACRRAMCKPVPKDCSEKYVIGEKYGASVVDTAMMLSGCERGSMDGPQIDTLRAALDWLRWRVMDGWDEPSDNFAERGRSDVDRAVRGLAMSAIEVARPGIEKSEFDSALWKMRSAQRRSVMASGSVASDPPPPVGQLLFETLKAHGISTEQLASRLGVRHESVLTDLMTATDFTGLTCELLGKALETTEFWLEASGRYRDWKDGRRESIECSLRDADMYRRLVRETYDHFYKKLVEAMAENHMFAIGNSEAQLLGDWLALPMRTGEQFLDWLEARGSKAPSHGSEEQRDVWFACALRAVSKGSCEERVENTGFSLFPIPDARAAEAHWLVLGLFDVRLAVAVGLSYLEDRGWLDREKLREFMRIYRAGDTDGLSSDLVPYAGNLATFALDELIRGLEGGAKAFFSVRGICRRQAYAQRMVALCDGDLDPQQEFVLRLLQISTLAMDGMSFFDLFEGSLRRLSHRSDKTGSFRFSFRDGDIYKRSAGSAIASAADMIVPSAPST